MKRFFILIVLLLTYVAARAQTAPPTFQYVSSAPSGSCPSTPTQTIQIVYSTGAQWACAAGTWTQVNASGGLSNPMTTQGDMIVGGTSGSPARLAANAVTGQGLLVSTAAQSTVAPTTKYCGAFTSGSGLTTTCTWNVSPVSGEFLVCGVLNNGSSSSFTLTDSASHTYTGIGSPHYGTTNAQYTQTFYTGPISSSVTTTTVTVPSGGTYLAIQCNSANNIAASSPTDGQATVDVSSGNFVQTPPITTTSGGDYIFCSAVTYFEGTLSAGPGFTAGSQAAYDYLAQYGTQNAAGPISPSMSQTYNGAATMTCSAFKSGTTVTPASNAWDQRVSISDIQANNTPVIPNPANPSGGDDYSNLQLAINTAIAENRELLIPTGAWKTSATLVANGLNVRIRGNGFQYNGTSANATSITATGTGYNTLYIGANTVDSASPNGYLRDIGIFGSGKPAVGSPSGVSCIQIAATVQFDIYGTTENGCDIGIDIINDAFGSQFTNNSVCEFGGCNAGIYLRNGNDSGSDLSFYNQWVDGAFCGVCIAGDGGGYHFWGGQINSGQSNPVFNDGAGAVVLNYDYLTASAAGSSSEDFHGTSFEGTELSWVFRGYGTNFLRCESCNFGASYFQATPAIGVYKSTNMQESRVEFDAVDLTGYYSNPQLLVMTGSTLGTSFLTENHTVSAAEIPWIDGAFVYVTSMAAQSGITAVGSDPYGLNANGMFFGNNSGSPAYSATYGGSWTNFFTNPMTTQGDLIYQGASVATRLPGNTTTAQEVLVSQGIHVTQPTTKTCATFNSGGTGNSATCTWSAAPVAGESVVCGVFNGNSSTLTMTDSATDTYTAYGSQFTTTNPNGFSLTFYALPLGGSITTTTVNSTSGSYLGLQCNTLNNMASSSPTDGQGSVNTTSNTIALGSPITTTVNGDYIFCSLWGQNGQSYTVGSGFTAGSGTTFVSETEYQAQTTAGAITPSMTQSNSLGATFSCAAFKSGSTGSAQSPTFTNSPLLALQSYTVSTLPSASSLAAGSHVMVTDANSFTPGTCTGGGSDTMIAVTNGTSWSCH